MKSEATRSRSEAWIALALCAAASASAVVELLRPGRPAYADAFAPSWLPLAAAGVAAAGIYVGLHGRVRWSRLGSSLSWGGLLLMLWAASGLPLDLLRVMSLLVPGLMPPGVDWPGLAARAAALGALAVLAHLALARPAVPASAPDSRLAGGWYGYAAFALALCYPLLKTWWALGGDLGLRWPGASGLDGSLTLWLPAVPWLLAAALSLLLVLTPRRLPRRLLLVAGWSATFIVATIGPVACWSLVRGLVDGTADFGGMDGWVFGLIYGSWLLWAIAAGAATRSFQLRTAAAPVASRCVPSSEPAAPARCRRPSPHRPERLGGPPHAYTRKAAGRD